MFERAREYLKLGAGRPPGTMWAMEKAYFELRRRYPGKEEYAYLRLALQTRYPEKSGSEITELVSDCRSLDDAIVKAVGVDFGHHVALRIRMDVLWNLPACSRCGKYRALSTTDNLCFGCRKFPGFAACTKCRLYWDDYPRICQHCGGAVWQITDGPGVPIIPVGGDDRPVHQDSPTVSEGANDASQEQLRVKESEALANLVVQLQNLEKRCAAVWDASVRERRQYRQLRRVDPEAAREFVHQARSPGVEDATLIGDLDRFLDALSTLYLGADAEVEAHKRLLGNVHGYAARAASKLKQAGTPEWLLRGLVAVSIDDGRSCQDYAFVLGQLYRNALDCGLKPSEFFSVVAKLSDNEMRGVLENFESSQDFAVFVRPYIGKNKS